LDWVAEAVGRTVSDDSKIKKVADCLQAAAWTVRDYLQCGDGSGFEDELAGLLPHLEEVAGMVEVQRPLTRSEFVETILTLSAASTAE
jgi:hypothetical protein